MKSSSLHNVSEIEQELIGIWQKLLEIQTITKADNFFKLGGDSLKTVELATEISKRYHYHLQVTDLLEKSLGDIAAILAQQKRRGFLSKVMSSLRKR